MKKIKIVLLVLLMAVCTITVPATDATKQVINGEYEVELLNENGIPGL